MIESIPVIAVNEITFTKAQIQKLAGYAKLNSIAAAIELAFAEKIFPMPTSWAEIGFVARLVENIKSDRLTEPMKGWVREVNLRERVTTVGSPNFDPRQLSIGQMYEVIKWANDVLAHQRPAMLRRVNLHLSQAIGADNSIMAVQLEFV